MTCLVRAFFVIVKTSNFTQVRCSSSEHRHHWDYGAASGSSSPGFVWRPFKHQCYSNLLTVVEGGSAVNSPIWELCRWEERMSCHLAPPSTLVPPRCSHYVHSGWAGHSWLILFNYTNCYVLHTLCLRITIVFDLGELLSVVSVRAGWRQPLTSPCSHTRLCPGPGVMSPKCHN